MLIEFAMSWVSGTSYLCTTTRQKEAITTTYRSWARAHVNMVYRRPQSLVMFYRVQESERRHKTDRTTLRGARKQTSAMESVSTQAFSK